MLWGPGSLSLPTLLRVGLGGDLLDCGLSASHAHFRGRRWGQDESGYAVVTNEPRSLSGFKNQNISGSMSSTWLGLSHSATQLTAARSVTRGLSRHCRWGTDRLEVPAGFSLPHPEVTRVLSAHVSLEMVRAPGCYQAGTRRRVMPHLVGRAVSTAPCQVVGPKASATSRVVCFPAPSPTPCSQTGTVFHADRGKGCLTGAPLSLSLSSAAIQLLWVHGDAAQEVHAGRDDRGE